MSKNIEERLLKIFEKGFGNIKEFGLDDELVKLGINSINFIKLIVEAEQEFGFEFSDEYLSTNQFKTLRDIIKYIDEKIQ